MSRDEVAEHAGAVHRHDLATLIRWIFIAAIVAGIVVVAMDNRRDVRLGYAFGDAQAPTWMVIVGTAVVGVAIGWLLRRGPRSRV